MVTIRRAQATDIPWLASQLALLDNFYSSRCPLMDPVLVTSQIKITMEQHFFIVSMKNKKPTGFMAGYVNPHPFNPAIRCLSEIVWWVMPEHRHGPSAALLLREFIRWGRKNVNWIVMSLPYKTRINPKTFYRMGFQSRERTFLMEVA